MDFCGPIKQISIAGIAVYDHSANLRHPTTWYLNQNHPYFSPTPIYHEPMTLNAGEKIRLRYRVLIHNSAPDAAALECEWKAFVASDNK